MNREENKVQKLSRVVFVSILLFFCFFNGRDDKDEPT